MNVDVPHIHFVTGRLAESAVRYAVKQASQQFAFNYSVDVLPITVAALMTTKWLVRHLVIPAHATRVILPGYLSEDLPEIRERLDERVECGPRDIRDLSMFFGGKRERDASYGASSIEILAEINHAPALTVEQLLGHAKRLVATGADVVDLGCTPGKRWQDVGAAVRELVSAGIAVSIDSFDSWEVGEACRNGAQLVLSVNSTNRDVASDWGTEVVVIPDVPRDEKSFKDSIDFLAKNSVPIRLDPILEPIGCGFTESLRSYMECRRSYPDAKMLMGIGNITELTDADSAGINVLLLGICQELGIQSVLTTEVINWARTSVQECDLGRQLVHFACTQKRPPKHIEPQLVLLRDEKTNEFDWESLGAMAQSIRDKNVRIFNCRQEIHAVSTGVHVHAADPFLVMQQLMESPIGSSIDAGHAFYLGFEMAKALTANTLGKRYTQDEALNWGYLTRSENHHRLARTNPSKRQPAPE